MLFLFNTALSIFFSNFLFSFVLWNTPDLALFWNLRNTPNFKKQGIFIYLCAAEINCLFFCCFSRNSRIVLNLSGLDLFQCFVVQDLKRYFHDIMDPLFRICDYENKIKYFHWRSVSISEMSLLSWMVRNIYFVLLRTILSIQYIFYKEIHIMDWKPANDNKKTIQHWQIVFLQNVLKFIFS